MEKQWFVLNTLTGQEAKAQKSIAARIKIERMEDYIGRCVIPSERVVEKKNGKKRTVTKRFFPGYVICELALYDEAKGVDENGKKAIYERTWQFSGGRDVARPKVDFNVDETVKIVDGAFMGLTGQVSMVDPDKGKLKVDVQVFGRKVPVDVEYWQVEKVSVEETFESAQR